MDSKILVSEEFPKDNIMYDEMLNINQYFFFIDYTKISSLEDKGIKRVLADLCMKELVLQLQSHKLFGFEKIRIEDVKDGPDKIIISYDDDVFGFSFSIGNALFSFQKHHCVFSDFLRTYDMFFDFIISLYLKIVAYIEGIGENIQFIPNKLTHNFRFELENFKSLTKKQNKKVFNYELMERLIPSLNDPNSPIGKVGYETRGRTDIKLSGHIKLEDVNYTTWVNITAPSNRNYSTMEFDFAFVNEVYQLPDGSREPFNPKSIIEWRGIFLILLKERTFNGFLKSWFHDITFDTVRK